MARLVMEGPVLRPNSVLLLLLLLGLPAGLGAGEINPTPAEINAAVAQAAGRHWYGVYFQNRKLGWASEEMSPKGATVQVSWEAVFRISMLGVTLETRMENQASYRTEGDFAMLEGRAQLTDRDRRQVATGKVVGERFEVVQDTNGREAKVSWELPVGSLLEAVPWAAAGRMKPGDTVSFSTADLTMLERSRQTVTFLGRRFAGSLLARTEVLEFQIKDDRGVTMRTLTTPEGQTLEAGFGPSLVLRLEDREQALRTEPSPLDLFLASIVPLDRPLDGKNLAALVRARFRLELPEGGTLPSDARQQARDLGEGEFELTIDTAGAFVDPAPDLTNPRWTACDATTGCDSPELKKAALDNVGEGRGLEAARKLAAFVHSHMKYELGVSYQRADEILKEGRGDCLEYSTLLVALCRGLGIPARVVSGLAYAGTETPGFAYHAWAEIQHEGRWVPLDPTWNAPVDAAHIKLDKEGGYAALSLLGSLKVKLLEADYSGSH
jgi:hypothetical protein